MSLVPIQLPPGVYRNGTKYQAKGRWYDCNLVRWFEGAMQAVGGWQKVQTSAHADLALTGPVRSVFAWQSNAGVPYLAFGTNEKAYAFCQGVLTDITPTDFTSGGADASITVGNYGAGVYGVNSYGVGDKTQGVLTPATSWQFDAFGETLLATSKPDGVIFMWDLDVAHKLTAVSGAPTNVSGMVVTDERFVFALGAGGDPRLVAWCDQENLGVWASDAQNQAGEFPLAGAGTLMTGRRGKNETLLWTDVDLFLARNIGGTLVYGFTNAGAKCGLIAPNAVAMWGSKAYWMGHHGFFLYDGFVQSVPCDVSDYVFSDMNLTQVSKIFAMPLSDYHETWWFYPSAKSNEIDRYVVYNDLEKIWITGELSRTAGIDRGPFPYPVMGDALGAVYEHERGTNTVSPAGAALTPYAESGPFELGQGDNVLAAVGLLPDDKTVGDVAMSFYTAFQPDGAETKVGPYPLSAKTDVRFTARQVRVRVDQVKPGWRVGIPRLDVVPGGRR